MKVKLETLLNANITTIALNWNKTTSYTLNSVPVDVDTLSQYIRVSLEPIEDNREVLGTANGIKYSAFFKLDIFQRNGQGTGAIFDTMDILDALLREHM